MQWLTYFRFNSICPHVLSAGSEAAVDDSESHLGQTGPSPTLYVRGKCLKFKTRPQRSQRQKERQRVVFMTRWMR